MIILIIQYTRKIYFSCSCIITIVLLHYYCIITKIVCNLYYLYYIHLLIMLYISMIIKSELQSHFIFII